MCTKKDVYGPEYETSPCRLCGKPNETGYSKFYGLTPPPPPLTDGVIAVYLHSACVEALPSDDLFYESEEQP